MSPVLLVFDHKENRRMLADYLESHCQVLPDLGDEINVPFDLAIVDGLALDRLAEQLRLRKAEEDPVLLPILLVTPRLEIGQAMRHLWQSIDDFIVSPVEKAELLARVRFLLNARDLSLQLKLRNDDLEAFVQAITHDLRAPARIASSFATTLAEEAGDRLGTDGLHYLTRIKESVEQVRLLLDRLVDFSRLGRRGVRKEPVDVRAVVGDCLGDLQEQVQSSGATVTVQEEMPDIQGDPFLLKVVLINLLSNALKFVLPGQAPRVEILATCTEEVCRVEVRDVGIGIAPDQQEKIFAPFVRLHGVEQYAGIGLGLAAVRKAADLMGGRVGVRSTPGAGSTFWIELPATPTRLSAGDEETAPMEAKGVYE